MKKYYKKELNYKISLFQRLVTSFIVLFFALGMQAQEVVPPKKDKPVRNTFNSIWLIDNQTVMVPIKGTFEFDILHRFGTIGNGYEDLFGFYASSNIRLGFSYTPIENLMVGFGLTKRKHILDFSAKYALIKQTRSGKIPVSLTYFGNMAIDTRKQEAREEVFNSSDRYSYFHQLIVARKFAPWLSIQVAGSLSHFNITPDNMNNNHFAISAGGKLNITESLAAIVNIDQPITQHAINNPNPNISFGLEISTSAHAFQIFLGNYSSIVPQENNFLNMNNYNPDDGENIGDNFLIGFNITRLWNY